MMCTESIEISSSPIMGQTSAIGWNSMSPSQQLELAVLGDSGERGHHRLPAVAVPVVEAHAGVVLGRHVAADQDGPLPHPDVAAASTVTSTHIGACMGRAPSVIRHVTK